MKKRYQVIFYRDKEKKSPFIDFLNNLDVKLRAKTLMMVHLLEEMALIYENLLLRV